MITPGSERVNERSCKQAALLTTALTKYRFVKLIQTLYLHILITGLLQLRIFKHKATI